MAAKKKKAPAKRASSDNIPVYDIDPQSGRTYHRGSMSKTEAIKELKTSGIKFKGVPKNKMLTGIESVPTWTGMELRAKYQPKPTLKTVTSAMPSTKTKPKPSPKGRGGSTKKK